MHARIGWAAEPGIIAPLIVTAAIYVRGMRKAGRAANRTHAACFATGMLVVAGALLSPLHEASEQIFSAHMIQHELLMAVAAPLLVIGRPGVVMLWGLPQDTRRWIGRVLSSASWRRTWHLLARPLDAWLLHALAIWCWHLPVLFQATLHSEAAHALQHTSFLGSALLFWWAIIHPRTRAALGLSVIYLFTTTLHTAALGALMSLAHRPWYPDYASGAAAWGLTPLEDQQLAGLMMWIPASAAYLVAALLILRRWLRESEWRVALDERAAVQS
jgi:cytochrome c oxidase assembly factor CtaG